MPYRDALKEILQAANCNHQIPAKLHEYLRASRPILALTDKTGGTAAASINSGIESIAPLDDADKIAGHLLLFIRQIRANEKCLLSTVPVKGFSRARSAELLANILEEVL